MVQHIILTILKFTGIFLGIVFLILLFLLLLLLFVPVRYEVQGKNEDQTEIYGKVHWLFHIVTYGAEYKEKELKQVLRIFGVPVWKK